MTLKSFVLEIMNSLISPTTKTLTGKSVDTPWAIIISDALEVLQFLKSGLHLRILIRVQVVVQQTCRATGSRHGALYIAGDDITQNHALRSQAVNLDT